VTASLDDLAQLGKDRRARLAHALQAVGHRDEDVAQPRVLRSLNTFIQNLAPSVCSIQSPRMSREPSGSTARAR
jgi:hypothetical protein